MEWPELLQRTSAYEASIHRLGWVRKALKSVEHEEASPLEPSAPPLAQFSGFTLETARPQPSYVSQPAASPTVPTSQNSEKGSVVKIAYAECPVCLSNMEEGCVTTPCCHNHIHRTCISQALVKRKTCPLCNQPVQISQLQTVRMPHIVVEEVNAPEKDKTQSSSLTAGSQNEAALRGAVATKRQYLAAHPETLDSNGRTKLHIAAQEGNLDDVLILMEQEADPEVKDNHGWTPLHLAVVHNRVEVITLLTSVYGADLDAVDKEGRTSLHLTVFSSDYKLGELLIQLGANPDARNNEGNTPLHLAIVSSNGKMIELLIKLGANPDARNNEGKTPLHLAAAKNDIQKITKLISGGAGLEVRDCVEATPLFDAVGVGSIEAIQALIGYGADMEATAGEVTPLDLAIKLDKPETSLTLVQEDARTDNLKPAELAKLRQWSRESGITLPSTPSSLTTEMSGSGSSVSEKPDLATQQMIVAAGEGDIELVNFLIQRRGVDPDAIRGTRRTALHIAVAQGKAAMVSNLIRLKANPNMLDKNNNTPLHLATIAGNTDVVLALINGGADKNALDKNKAAPIHIAIINSHYDVVKILIEQGANLEGQMINGLTPLMIAVSVDDVDTAIALVQGGANIEILSDKLYRWLREAGITPPYTTRSKTGSTEIRHADKPGKTLAAEFVATLDAGAKKSEMSDLHMAVKEANTQKTIDLIHRDADLEARDKDGFTPLHMAASSENDNIEVVRILLQHHAHLEARNSDGQTPLFLAIAKGNIKITMKLLQRHACTGMQDKLGRTPLHTALRHSRAITALSIIESGAPIDIQDNRKNTPLHEAAESGQTEIAMALIQKGAAREVKNWQNETPLSLAIRAGKKRTAILLIQTGAKPENLRSDLFAIANQWLQEATRTPAAASRPEPDPKLLKRIEEEKWDIFTAAQEGSAEAARILINQGADVNMRYRGQAPLLMAAGKGHTEVARILIENGARCNENSGGQGATALAVAARNGHVDTVRLLIDKRADVNKKCAVDGDTPLHNAAAIGHTEIIKMLIKAKARVDMLTNNGSTPLHVAAEQGHTDATLVLIQLGAQIDLLTNFGLTPLTLAMSRGHTGTVEAILAYKRIINSD